MLPTCCAESHGIIDASPSNEVNEIFGNFPAEYRSQMGNKLQKSMEELVSIRN